MEHARLFGVQEFVTVIPSLIKKCVDAVERGEPAITVWGTGKATREVLDAAEAAEGIVLAAERYDGADPISLGSGIEISIRDLVGLVAKHTRFRGRPGCRLRGRRRSGGHRA